MHGYARQRGADGCHPVGRLGQHRRSDRQDVPAPGDAGHAVDVVGVEVAQHQQLHPVDAEPAQAAVHERRLGAGVDHDRAARPDGQHERVALADIARDHEGPGRRPPAGQHPYGQPADGRAHRHHEGDPPRRPPPGRHQQSERHRGEQQPAGEPVGPRQVAGRHVGTPVGDRHEPAGGPAGQPGQELGRARPDRRDGGGQHAEHGGRRDRRDGQQVGRHGHRAHGAGQRGDDRPAGDLGGGRDGERLRDHAGHPAGHHRVPPARRQQHEPAGGQHGQRETGIAGQVGVDQHEHEGGRREGRRRGPPPSSAEGQQPDGAHGGGAQHARRGAREDDEPDENERAHGHARPGSGPAAPAYDEHHRQDDRDVGPADGDQVGEPGGAEVLRQRRVQPAGIADHQARQQAARLVGQRGSGVLQPAAQPPGRPLRPRRLAEPLRRLAYPQHGGREVTAPRLDEPPVGADPLARQQRRPRGVAGQHEDPHVERQAGVHPLEPPAHEVRGRSGRTHQACRVVRHDEPRRHLRTVGHQARQCGRVARRGAGRDGHSRAEHPQQYARERAERGAPTRRAHQQRPRAGGEDGRAGGHHERRPRRCRNDRHGGEPGAGRQAV
ncbi:hypothetical protein GCM10009681_31060 [Luedemannella helvata]|uniref:Uncharacterized protein n=1 Tax=Luedemannella helvata TaxID=349315 RepID=A0ABN2KL19_9ACTN